MIHFNLLPKNHSHKSIKTMGIILIFTLFLLALLSFQYYEETHDFSFKLKEAESKTQQLKEKIDALENIETIKNITVASSPGLLSLKQSHTDIRSILETIAIAGSKNLILHESVQGILSVDFHELPWEKALEITLEMGQLVAEKREDVLLVRSLENENKRLMEEKNRLQAEQQLIPLEYQLLSLYHAKAKDIAHLIQTHPEQWLSERGTLDVDERSNSLIIRDIPEKIKNIKTLLQSLDFPSRQVAIEARIMNVEKSISKKWGLNWETNGTLSLSEGMEISTLSHQAMLNIELQALENENKVEELAHPRLITANQTTAIIRQGEEIPYQQYADYGATTVNFKPAVLELQVTPQISSNNLILLKLIIKNDTRSLQALADNIPVITTKEIRTEVLVKNGETIVLGGIYTQGKNLQEDKLPLLSKIPGVGALFSHNHQIDEQKELIVFVTPHIIG